MTTRNYYEVLGLAPFADGGMVDQAYWHLAKTYQTEAVGDPRARLLLDELNEAYAVLGTPRLREAYDTEISGTAVAATRTAPARETRKGQSGRGFRPSLPRLPFGGSKKTEVSAALSSDVPGTAPGQVMAAATADTTAARPSKKDINDLRASTAKMLDRWRANAGIQAQPQDSEPQPDMTLVDIFRTEKDLESHDDPLAAVMDILKARDTVPTRSD
jgi:curved DNA-binding protein CbpA